MALAKQFYSSFKSYNGWEYYLEIWVESYSGSASEISLGVSGPVITYGTDQEDRFSPILSSKLELPFMVTNATEDAFIKNIREQFNERDVYIHLYRANSSDYSSVAPLWSGYVLMDLSASPDLYYPYPVTLTAVDGLALLKEIDFVQSGTAGSYSDSDMYSSNGRFTYWIKEILLKIGASTTTEGSTQDYKFTTAINWFNSVMPTITQSTDPFYQTKCGTKMFFSKDSDGNFTVVNTYDVLLNLLKHWGARIIYWKHIFYIVQIQEYNTAESGTYANPDNINTRTYTKTGAFDSSSDNLGDSYWTRYNLLIDDVTGGIQKLAGSQFNYLPQLKRTQANFLDYGNKNYFGGIPFDLTTGETDVILQSTFEDVSADGAMLLIIPLDVTIVQQYNGSLDLRIFFRLFITDGATTYYLRYDATNTPNYYWESSTTVNLNNNQTRWYSKLDNLIGTQTKIGFHELIEFKDSGGSTLNLSGEWKAYIDIDNWVQNIASSFYFYASVSGMGGQSTKVYVPSLTTVYYTNTLNSNYQTTINTVILGTTNSQITGITNYPLNNIISYQTSLNINPFEGKFLIVNTSASGAIYGSQVMITPQTTTSDVEVVDFGDLIWGDTLFASSEGSLKVWNGSAFVKSNVTGTWGLGSTSGSNSFTEMLLSEYLFGQTKVVESPSMQLVIGETNKNQNDGSGSRPNYVNPIGRLKGYSATGTTPYYIFKSGSFHLLRDEIEYEGYQIIRNTETVTKTDNIIIGPDVLQDKTNKISQKTPVSNTLAAKLTQNSFISTISSTKSAYGNDIAVNGIFASDSSWTKGTGWSIASNKASFSPTGSTSDIKQDTLTNALTYKITLSVSVSAGGLSVKAGSSGNETVLSASGTYDIFSTCSGSTDVIFEASAAFEGYIEKVVVKQQVPITSININAIGAAVFKANDVLNIANFDSNEINEFTVSSDQGASDTSIAVTSKLITEDIPEGSIILINQNDLAAQYQNKTKGTVAGFTIDADGIAKGGVEITGWLDSDTMSGATANNVPTAESVKAYVDAQVGSADTLQEVTDNGNTTTNSITFAGGTSTGSLITSNGNILGSSFLFVHAQSSYLQLRSSSSDIYYDGVNHYFRNNNGSSVLTKITSGGNVLIGTTTEHSGSILNVSGGNVRFASQANNEDRFLFETGVSSAHPELKIYDKNESQVISINANPANPTYFNSGANFGIGTSSPDKLLEIFNGDLKIGDNSNSARRIFFERNTLDIGSLGTNNSSLTLKALDNNDISLEDDSGNGLIVKDGGNVLIGTTTDSGAKLSVVANTTYQPLLVLRNTGTDASNDIYMGYNRDNSTGSDGWSTGIDSTDNSFNISEDADNINTNVRLKIAAGGNATFSGQVTIPATPVASTDAASKSYVDAQVGSADTLQEVTDNGASTTNDMTISNGAPSMILQDSTSGSSTVIARNSFRNNVNAEIGTVGFLGDGDLRLTNVLSNNITFYTNNAEKARITSDGNLLVGGTSDTDKLVVSGAIRVTSNISFDSGKSGRIYKASNHGLAIHGVTGTENDFAMFTPAGQLKIVVPTGTNNVSLNPTSGNVLIGTTTDSGEKLVVDGTAKVEQYFYINDTGNTNNFSIRNESTYATISNETRTLNFIGGDKIFSNGSFAEAMRIKSSTGNVLIGTTSGTSTLEIEKTTTTGSGFKLRRNLSSGSMDSPLVNIVEDSQYADETTLRIQNDGSGDIINVFDGTTEVFTILDGGNVEIQGTLNVGVDDTGYDVKFFGATSGRYLQWDESADKLLLRDNVKGVFGNASDLQIFHDASNSYIYHGGTGNLYIKNETDGQDVILQCDDGSGGVTAYITLDGSVTRTIFSQEARFTDSVNLKFGNGGDMMLYHNGSNSYIDQTGTGDLYIRQGQDGKDIVFQCDNGSGGLTSYLTLDGSQTTVNISQNLLINTTTDAGVPLYVNGVIRAVGGGIQAAQDYGFTLNDEAGNNRYGLKFGAAGSVGGSDLLMLTNRSIYSAATSGGIVTIGGNSSTTGVSEVEIARFDPRVSATSGTQKKVTLDAVLELTAQTDPANPANSKSIIWMDTNGNIKAKMTDSGGTTVTRTIAAFE